MAQPLYFLPKLRAADVIENGRLKTAVLAERGLAETFEGCLSTADVAAGELTGRGPGDQHGVILCYLRSDGQIPRRIGYTPAEQTWLPVGGEDRLWIGIDPTEPPTPADLARPKLSECYRHLPAEYWVPLADGQRWLVPPIRRPDGSTMLPTDMHFDAAGQFVERVKDRYRRQFEAMIEVLPIFFDDIAGAEIHRPRGLELATEVLGILYRFGPLEQAALHLLDTTNYCEVLGRAVDLPAYLRIEEAQKKNRSIPPAENTTPGSPAGSPATDPATAN